MLAYSRPWLEAWVISASGPGGFWRKNCPAGHFRTAAATTPLLGEAISGLLAEHRQIGMVVDLGAGGGELLNWLAERLPMLRLAGIDIRARPPALAPSIEWRRDTWDVLTGRWQDGQLDQLLAEIGAPALITCLEWLDDLPCRVTAAGSEGWCEVLVDPSGAERPGNLVAGDDLDWLRDWWPAGSRAEVGTTRDEAWASTVRSLRPSGGLALMIDYGHVRQDRPVAGSLAGYREGRLVPTQPSSGVNLTAAVAVDALEAAGVAAGARTIRLAQQADVVAASRPVSLTEDPLAGLVARSELAALRSPRVWGRQWWLLQAVPRRGARPGNQP